MSTQANNRIEDVTPMPRIDGPGAQLRQARLDLKLQPEDVAHILHLSARQIVALEGDDYEHLPGPTYVRGYLRGYAQLLGLSAEPVIETYNRLVAAKKPVDLGKLAPKAEIRSDHQMIKLATVAVIATVVGLSAVWWREQERPSTPPAAPEQVTSASEPDQSDAATAASETETAHAPLPTVNVATSPPAPAVASPKTPAVAKEREAVATPKPVTPAAPPAAPTAGPRGRLVLQAQLDSWVDVRDALGNRLLYETIAAGHSVTIEGATPLSVFLGNVDGMRVEFNGESYDASRHKRGEIARFTLGEGARGQ